MHEAAITQALMDQVQSLIPAGGRLQRVRVEVGAMEHLDSEVMRAMWVAMIDESPLVGAELDIERIAVRVRCRHCGVEHSPSDPAVLICPSCGLVRPEMLAGAGILLRSLEVDVEDHDG